MEVQHHAHAVEAHGRPERAVIAVEGDREGGAEAVAVLALQAFEPHTRPVDDGGSWPRSGECYVTSEAPGPAFRTRLPITSRVAATGACGCAT